MLFEVVLQQDFFGSEMINRWNYTFTGTPASVTLSFALASAMGGIIGEVGVTFPEGTLLREMQGIQMPAVRYVQLVVKNIYDLSDFYATPYGTNVLGTHSGAIAAPPYVAYGLRSTQVTRAIRGGQKRIGGVSQENIATGGVINPADLELVAALAELMSNPVTYIDEGTTLSFVPVVVQKQKYTTPRGNIAYKYYPTLAEQVPAHVAIQPLWASQGNNVRSQVSRQYKVGA